MGSLIQLQTHGGSGLPKLAAHQLKQDLKPDASKTHSRGKSKDLSISIHTYATCCMHSHVLVSLGLDDMLQCKADEYACKQSV